MSHARATLLCLANSGGTIALPSVQYPPLLQQKAVAYSPALGARGFALDHVCSPCALVEYATHRADDNREVKESFDGIDHDADPPSGVVSRANDKLHLNE
jgi:hypothetical protein